MRPRPEAIVPAAVIAALLALAWSTPAVAQVGLGAERYEVTITPPKRPGSEAAAGATVPAAPVADPDKVLGAVDAPASGDAASATGGAESTASEAKKETGAASSAKADAPAPGPGTIGASSAQVARVDPNLPKRTLQVGAFRQRSSAVAMRDKLTASFPDVAIMEVQSGGEVLYRVNVGRLPRGTGLDDLRRRLVAAGHPAFEVPAPSMPAGN